MTQEIFNWSVRAVLMGAGTWLLLFLLRVRTAAALHRAWTAVIVAMLLLPLWTTWGPSIDAPLRATSIPRPLLAPLLPAVAELRPIVRYTSPRPPTAIASPPPTLTPTDRSENPWNWELILLTAYFAGFTIMFLRLAIGTGQILLLKRRAQRTERFLVSSACSAPITIGWLRPQPVLPESWPGWSAAKLDAVLTHEREHVRRRDPLVQWIALLNRCVFWFHPLAWWLKRKSAALSEIACDQAVIARGHAPQDYSQYLVELARSVSSGGSRIRQAGVTAFSDGSLPARVRQMMERPQPASLSRVRALASLALCCAMLFAVLACNVHRIETTARRRPPTDAERIYDRLVRQPRPHRRTSDSDLARAALALTPATAKTLYSEVRSIPVDADKLTELIRYYQAKKNFLALDELTYWLIEHQPGMRQGWGYSPVWDRPWTPAGYDRGKTLWMAQLQASPANPYVYMNAADYLESRDWELEERVLAEGTGRFPVAGLHWEVLLACHYAHILTGQPAGGRCPANPDLLRTEPLDGSYAQKIRASLSGSRNVELLLRTAEAMPSDRAFALTLLAQVISVEPGNRWAHVQRENMRFDEIRRRQVSAPNSFTSPPDRIALLIVQLVDGQRAGIGGRSLDGYSQGQDGTARELLALAAANPKTPDYGTAVYLANITLGNAAFNQKDTAAAGRCLLAASEAPTTEYLRYSQLDMNLAHRLADAGETATVAKYLDRCAKFNNGGKPLAQWAERIRRGETVFHSLLDPPQRPGTPVTNPLRLIDLRLRRFRVQTLRPLLLRMRANSVNVRTAANLPR